MSVQIAALGRMNPRARQVWTQHLPVTRVVELHHPAPSGYRLGRRALGIGLDAGLVAVKARCGEGASSTLAMNPWPGVACRLVGLPDVAVAGIYAVAGSRSWRILRSRLGASPVVCTSVAEARAWVADGGRAEAVLWGGSVSPPLSHTATRPRVFVGGTSDRDPALLAALVKEVQQDGIQVDVVIADGSGPRNWVGQNATVRWLPYVSADEFVNELAACQVSFIPLKNVSRAAGHMVLSASLEAGLPTVSPWAEGMAEYLEHGVTVLAEGAPILKTLVAAAEADVDERQRLHRVWEDNLSLTVYIRRAVEAFGRLGWPA